MHDATAADITIFAVIVGLRLILPLFIPLVPLPAMIACLVIDAADQTIFQQHLTPSVWDGWQNSYQSYDKALDIYYLAMAYVSTLRNWTNLTAIRTAQFLWYYRLVGVTLFESLHVESDPSSWRWLLLVFPNTFEYFFDAYEIVRLRWDPRRMSPRFVIGLAAFIWIFIKLPQEYWIHVAQLDFTDFADNHSWVYPSLAVLAVVAVVVIWYLVSHVLPAKDWTLKVLADKPPQVPDRVRKLLAWPLLEKVVLIALVSAIFYSMLPGEAPTALSLLIGTAIFVTIDSAFSSVAGLYRRSMGQSVGLFLGLVVLNLGTVELLHLVTSVRVSHALFFAFLLSLIVTWYDRYRPVLDLRREQAEGQDQAAQPSGAPS